MKSRYFNQCIRLINLSTNTVEVGVCIKFDSNRIFNDTLRGRRFFRRIALGIDPASLSAVGLPSFLVDKFVVAHYLFSCLPNVGFASLWFSRFRSRAGLSPVGRHINFQTRLIRRCRISAANRIVVPAEALSWPSDRPAWHCLERRRLILLRQFPLRPCRRLAHLLPQ